MSLSWNHGMPVALPGGLSSGDDYELLRRRRRENDLAWSGEVELSSTIWRLGDAMLTKDYGLVASHARGFYQVPLNAECRIGRAKQGRCRLVVLVVEGVGEFRERCGRIWFKRDRGQEVA